MKKEKKVVHLELIENQTHYYFGSLKAIYDEFPLERLGISYNSLKNIRLTQEKCFKNNFCIIRIGVLKSTESNRGKYLRFQKPHSTNY